MSASELLQALPLLERGTGERGQIPDRIGVGNGFEIETGLPLHPLLQLRRDLLRRRSEADFVTSV
jgi:hypothetical protein